MAHAGSGSAFPAKSGGLKFSDVVRERFRGPAFGQDFTTWLNDVYLGFESAHVPESSQATHLVAFPCAHHVEDGAGEDRAAVPLYIATFSAP